jgi:hypothetical protein
MQSGVDLTEIALAKSSRAVRSSAIWMAQHWQLAKVLGLTVVATLPVRPNRMMDLPGQKPAAGGCRRLEEGR